MTVEESLKADRVRHLSPSVPITVTPETPVAEVIATMKENRIGCVLIVTEGNLQGIFTERDLLLKVLGTQAEMNTPVGDHMTKSPSSVSIDATIAEAIVLMHKGGYRHMPVTTAEGEHRIVSSRDITHYIVEHFPLEILNLPPNPDQKQESREGA